MQTILIVEDNHLNLKLVSMVLSLAGYRVISACDAEQALEILCAQRPDLILMDIQLPGMDGNQATEAIRADEKLSTIPIVALTANALKDQRDRAFEAGCDRYITKPVRPKEILEVVATLLAAT